MTGHKLLACFALAGVFALASSTMAQPAPGRRFEPNDQRLKPGAPRPNAPAPRPAPKPAPKDEVRHGAFYEKDVRGDGRGKNDGRWESRDHDDRRDAWSRPGHRPDYRPGYHGFELERPHHRDFYRAWPFVTSKYYYMYESIPQNMQIALDEDDVFEFKLEENATTGYSWFARYDPGMCKVDIEHKAARKQGWRTGAPGVAEIEIEAKAPGDTVVELIYARRWEWEQGQAPAKVIQVFLHINPEW